MTTPKIITKEAFSKEVQELVIQSGTTYMDAILCMSEQSSIEVETAAKLLTPHLKNMVEKEAAELNLLEKRTSLKFEPQDP